MTEVVADMAQASVTWVMVVVMVVIAIVAVVAAMLASSPMQQQ